MHDVSNDLVPSNIKNVFLPTAKVHSYNTRSSASNNQGLKSNVNRSQELVRDCGMSYQQSSEYYSDWVCTAVMSK